jgi:cysteine desulfurase/selenocysteine lyase
VPHIPVRVEELGVDFLAFSAHKMLGPTGVGVLWGRPDILEAMDPYMGGGEMIREVKLDSATWNDVPWKFEAGTPNIADVVAFSTALDYLTAIGMDNVRRHEVELTAYALDRLRALGHVTLYGPESAEARSGVVTFNDFDIHPHDLATILDHHGVAVRAGHHCAQPVMERFGVPATVRASVAMYTTTEELDRLVDAVARVREVFR